MIIEYKKELEKATKEYQEIYDIEKLVIEINHYKLQNYDMYQELIELNEELKSYKLGTTKAVQVSFTMNDKINIIEENKKDIKRVKEELKALVEKY